MRDGTVQRVASQALVTGHHLRIAEGDRLACDATLLGANGLRVDESLRSGESAPVLKSASQALHAGTPVVSGAGTATVCATGAATTLGRIGGALARSIVPEEFAVVWSVVLALGAWRLARLGGLTRQAQAIEALGATSVLCVDKTGTLTHNRMALVALMTPEHSTTVAAQAGADARFQALLRTTAWASVDKGIEPMDQAVIRLAQRWFITAQAPGVLLLRNNVAAERPWFQNRWRAQDRHGAVLAIKGAPESVLALCDIEPALRGRVTADADRMARQGLRVLGVAHADSQADPGTAGTMPRPRWIGLLGFLAPVRDGVPPAMAQCHHAGIRVVTITGNAPATHRRPRWPLRKWLAWLAWPRATRPRWSTARTWPR